MCHWTMLPTVIQGSRVKLSKDTREARAPLQGSFRTGFSLINAGVLDPILPEVDPEPRTPGRVIYLGGAENTGWEVGKAAYYKGGAITPPAQGATKLPPVEELQEPGKAPASPGKDESSEQSIQQDLRGPGRGLLGVRGWCNVPGTCDLPWIWNKPPSTELKMPVVRSTRITLRWWRPWGHRRAPATSLCWPVPPACSPTELSSSRCTSSGFHLLVSPLVAREPGQLSPCPYPWGPFQ